MLSLCFSQWKCPKMLKYRCQLYLDLWEETTFHLGNMRHGIQKQTKKIVILQMFAGSDRKQGVKAALYSFLGQFCG